jgi:formylglycine-generating enzyme required for sulfatase activity
MRGANLTGMLLVESTGEGQLLSAQDFPYAVGVADGGSPVFGQAAEPTAVAWLGQQDGEVFIEPVRGPRVVRLNGKPLERSAWLVAGDTIAIGATSMAVLERQGVLTLSVHDMARPEAAGALAMPAAEGPATDATAGERPTRIGPMRQPRTRGFIAVTAVFVALAVGVVFVSVASPVRLMISPAPDSVSFRGLVPAVPFAGSYLALPGRYSLLAEKEGFRKLERQITVAFGSESTHQFELRELPGYLDVVARPPIAAEVTVGGKAIGTTPLKGIELEPGRYELRVVAHRYHAFSRSVDVRGRGETHSVEAELLPAWGSLEITSEPSGAQVRLNGADVGVTPLQVEPLAGRYTVDVRKSGWKPGSRTLTVKANERLALPRFTLEKSDAHRAVEPSIVSRAGDPPAAPVAPSSPPAPAVATREGTLTVTTSPPGATVTINGKSHGLSPIALTLASGTDHTIVAHKDGFEAVSRTVHLHADGRASLHVDLAAQYGIVFVNTRPAGATLSVDGKFAGSGSQRLELPSTAHRLELAKPGYATYSVTVTPLPGVSKTIEVSLEKLGAPPGDRGPRSDVKTAGGQVLRLIRLDKPVRFKMGSSRREAGRRSNEAAYWVELTRSFYLSEKEVTNAEFQKFSAQHSSGNAHGTDLTAPDQPVVSVSWDDAARYLNWLSSQEGLPPAYRESDGKMVPIQPPTTGYRLPTEAEWAFAARYEGGHRSMDQPLKFSWDGGMPPLTASGNYADETASGKLPLIIKGYSDGYAASGPVGKFPPNKAGLFDLGGNVSEWIHDHYEVHTGRGDDVLRDPMGPGTGSAHVVRGSSWRHGSVTELRLSYRDDAVKPRHDLGFRIARYATEPTN